MKRITWAEAEKRLKGRVDRREAFYLHGRQVLQIDRGTATCSGCFNTEDGHPIGEYPWDPKSRCYLGSGCSECGYTGKRRYEYPFPALTLEAKRSMKERT